MQNVQLIQNGQRLNLCLTSVGCTLLTTSFFEKLKTWLSPAPSHSSNHLFTCSWSCQQCAPHHCGWGTFPPHWVASPWGFCYQASTMTYTLRTAPNPPGLPDPHFPTVYINATPSVVQIQKHGHSLGARQKHRLPGPTSTS